MAVLAVEVVPCTADDVGLAADDDVEDVEDEERERLAERDFAVGSSEHEEEQRRHKEHQVARDDGDVDDERVDGNHAAADDDEHVEEHGARDRADTDVAVQDEHADGADEHVGDLCTRGHQRRARKVGRQVCHCAQHVQCRDEKVVCGVVSQHDELFCDFHGLGL